MGIVLAGGASRRMGEDKATVVVGGAPMARWVTRAVTAVCTRSAVVGRTGSLEGLEAIPDHGDPRLGPLSGLVTALSTFRAPILLVGVDQPLVKQATLTELAKLAVAGETAVCFDEVEQVTCAAYQPDLLEPARSHLEGGGSIRTMLASHPHTRIEEPEWRTWGEDGRSWFSMDSQSDIVDAERRFRVSLLD